MSRLIDADALIKSLDDAIQDAIRKDEICDYWEDDRSNLLYYLDNAPTIDAVEVVRKPIEGYEGYYEVDQFGRVFSVDRVIRVNDNGREYDKPIKGGQLKQHMHSKGYKIVCLTKDGKSKNVYVHRLVAEAFIENQNGFPFINHKDEDKTNNFADNLEWCTNEYNVNYGKGKERRRKKIIGRPLSEEHKRKISEGLRRYHGERKESE